MNTRDAAKRLRRPKQTRERISDTLERVKNTGGYFDHQYVFTGTMTTICPRCQKPATVTGATLYLDLSCGCSWHPPRHDRKHDKAAWLSYEKTN